MCKGVFWVCVVEMFMLVYVRKKAELFNCIEIERQNRFFNVRVLK